MTTITLVKKNGVVAIAADSMTKWGDAKETAHYVVNHEKIIRLGDSFVALTGAPSAKLILKDYFAKPKNKSAKFDSISTIFSAWLGLHAAMKETYFLNASDDEEASFETSQVDVGIANAHGIFGVGRYRDVQEYSRFYALGSGYSYAVGAMFAIYEDPNKTAEEIARLGVEAAADFDDATGLPVFSYTIPLIEKTENETEAIKVTESTAKPKTARKPKA